jgi:hypothetical protein
MKIKNETTLKKNTFLSALVKKCYPHIIALIIMYILTLIYFSPIFFDGKDLPQSDMVSVEAMAKEVKDYQEKTGEYSGWTNAMFSGMPTITIYGEPTFNIFGYCSNVLRGGLPLFHAGMLFAYLLGFYIFMLCIGANAWMALLGAVVYAFASYNIIIIEAGHVTKGYAMAYLAPMIGGIILAFRKKYWLGAIITLLFLGVEISCNHIQITYYGVIIVGIVGLVYFFHYILKEKTLKPFFKAMGVLVVAAILAIIPNVGTLLPTYVYSKDTMRGGSELTIVPEERQQSVNTTTPNEGGLEKDYAFAWSYGKMETFTLLVPNLYGGGHTELKPDSETFQNLRQNGYGSSFIPTYWGEQPFTSGPVYAGAIVCFLFVLGFFLVKGPEKWWIIAVFVVSLILSWGKNFDVINDFLFHHLPFYNKFRTPSMALIIAGVAMPILGMLGLKELFSNKLSKDIILKNLKVSYFITAGLCLFLALCAAMIFDFTGSGDAQFKDQLMKAGFDENRAGSILSILMDYRQSMVYRDVFRSLVFISLAFGLMWFHIKGSLKNINIVITSLTLLVLIDGWAVSKRYLNDDDFQAKNKVKNIHQPSEADRMILQDPDNNYRVLNLTSNTFNESSTSYFHKSIGGYSPAKLRRYQDMIDFHISSEIQSLYTEIMNNQGNIGLVNPEKFKVLNMLNTKYFILSGGNQQPIPLKNPYAYGNVWIADGYKIVDNPDQEILALYNVNVKDTVVIDKRFMEMVNNKDLSRDTNAKIINTLCHPNHLTYTSNFNKDQLTVFSEVFYKTGGWVSYLDGKEVPHFRVNYILRAMVVPAGEHTIEFKYIPHMSILSGKIAMASSIVVILILITALGFAIYRYRKIKSV